MAQPQHDALPADRWVVDRAFQAIISAPEPHSVDAVPGSREGARRDIRRIASTLFCSSSVDPSIVAFAKRRSAEYWGLAEDEIDVEVTVRLLAKAALLMTDRHVLAADEPIGAVADLAPAA